MKIFSRQFMGTALIWLGVIFFLAVIYDSVRPYFPRRIKYSFVNKIQNLFKSAKTRFPFSRTTSPPRAAAVEKSTGRQPPPKPKLPLSNKFLTHNIYHPGQTYHLWVWGVKPELKTGKKIKLEMAHAAPGKEGGFWMVAYADTNGDGKPDQQIAKSGYFEAEKTGQWSVWELETDKERIFVGNTWPEDIEAAVYRDNGPWPQGPFEGIFYHRISPIQRGAAFTNMRISFLD